MSHLLLLFVCGVLSQSSAPGGTTGPTIWLTGQKFEWALDQPVVATWQNAEFRRAVESLSEQRQIPLVIDRRLDPNRIFTHEIRNISLRETFGQLSAIASGGYSITDQTVYLGPAPAAGKLRTLIALRQSESQAALGKLPAVRRKLFTERRSLHWDDLDNPRDILRQIVDGRGLRIKNIEQVPHDLWARGDLPAISLEEALTLVLIQFDLTFQLNATESQIELTPIPMTVAIEKQWSLPRAKSAEITRAIQTELPQVAATLTAEQLVAQGTQEQLEDLERLIRAMTSGPTTRKPGKPARLNQRRLTFQAKDAPLSAILEKLSGTGISFDYDRQQLKASGIDIDQLVAIDVKEVPPEELFDKLLTPAGIAFKVDGLHVTLTPAPSK